MNESITTTDIKGAKKLFSGKVRDVYEVDSEHLILVSTDRLSAFDHVFPNGIHGKGKILNEISNFWFSKIDFIKNHIVETDYKKFPKPYSSCDFLEGRSILVKKTKKIDFECIARGYIIGSGWKDYQNTGEICGIKIPSGMLMAEKFESPLFTPSTKADTGHDENTSIEAIEQIYGKKITHQLESLTLQIYNFAHDLLNNSDIILADTKIEFGIINDEIILIDEVLTPDSSRFWDKKLYKKGTSPISYDKQYIRDYLDKTTWDKQSPPPVLPEDVIQKTLEKYNQILQRILLIK